MEREPGYDAPGPAREQLEALRVVRAGGHDHVDPFFLVKLELVVEDLFVEGILQALVGKIDQQLLELVLSVEVLETCQGSIASGVWH